MASFYTLVNDKFQWRPGLEPLQFAPTLLASLLLHYIIMTSESHQTHNALNGRRRTLYAGLTLGTETEYSGTSGVTR